VEGHQNRSRFVLPLSLWFTYGTAGFLIVTLLLFLFLLGVIEKKRWPFAVLVSLIVTVASYLVFEIALQSQLPKGLMEFLRF
jgi:hypothetical protein